MPLSSAKIRSGLVQVLLSGRRRCRTRQGSRTCDASSGVRGFVEDRRSDVPRQNKAFGWAGRPDCLFPILHGSSLQHLTRAREDITIVGKSPAFATTRGSCPCFGSLPEIPLPRRYSTSDEIATLLKSNRSFSFGGDHCPAWLGAPCCVLQLRCKDRHVDRYLRIAQERGIRIAGVGGEGNLELLQVHESIAVRM